jgi:lipoprotein NlpI
MKRVFLLCLALAGCGGEDVRNCTAMRRTASEQALAHCNHALDNRLVFGERRAAVLVDRAAALADRREWDRAIADLTQAINSDKLAERNRVVAYYDRGTVYGQKGDLDPAIADLGEAIRIDPVYIDAYVNRALARRGKGDLAGALADANAALKLDPNHAKAMVQRGVTYFMLKDLDNALVDLSAAAKLAPDLPAARHLRGILLASRGEAEAALVEFDAAIRLEPGNLDALTRRAGIHEQRQDYGRALADLDAAEKLAPKNAALLFLRSLVRARKGDLDGAFADVERALTLDPKIPDGYNTRGWIKLQRKDADGAITDFDQALALDPKHLLARANRANALAAKGEHARAVADLEAIAAASPPNANHRSIGLFRYYLGQYAESAAALERALQAQPSDHYSAIWRYLAQSRAGQAQQARPALAEAAKALPAGKWPAPVVDFYLGKATEPALMAAAHHADPKTQSEQVCEANFYAGAFKALRNQAAQALPLLRAAEKGCPREFVEYNGALAELRLLKQ